MPPAPQPNEGHDPSSSKQSSADQTLSLPALSSDGSLTVFLEKFAKHWPKIGALITPESGFTLPKELDQKVLESVRGGGVRLVQGILGDKELTRKLLATQMWSSEDHLRTTLNDIAFAQPNDDTIRSVRQLTQTFLAGDDQSHIVQVTADLLLDRRIGSVAFMEITDELLRGINPMLAENLTGLLKANPDVQFRSMQWLFDHMCECCEDAVRTDSERPLLTARIIFKQLTRVLEDHDSKKWLGLQTHIVMRFAERFSAEYGATDKPIMSFFMALQPKLAIDFLLAVDTNFSHIGPTFNNTIDRQQADQTTKLLSSYGGFEVYAQGVETLLSFGVGAYPDKFYDYLYSRYDDVTPLMQSQYLAALKFGIHRKGDHGEREIDPKRVDFVLEQLIGLSGHRYSFVQSRLHGVLQHKAVNSEQSIAEVMLDKLCTDDRYQSLPADKRSFLVEFLLYTARDRLVEGAAAAIIPLTDFEMLQEQNQIIQSKVFWSDFYSAEVRELLTPEQATHVRRTILDGFEQFGSNDILAEKLLVIMSAYGATALAETYETFLQVTRTDFDRSTRLLEFLGQQAQLLPESLPAEEQQAFERVLFRVCALARNLSLQKMDEVGNYYTLRNKVAEALREMVTFQGRLEGVTATSTAINAEVARLDGEKRDLEKERQKLEIACKKLERSQISLKNQERDLVALLRGRPIQQQIPLFGAFFKASEASLHAIESLRQVRTTIATDRKKFTQTKTDLEVNKERLAELKIDHDIAQEKQTKMTEAVGELRQIEERLIKYAESGKQLTTQQKQKMQSLFDKVERFHAGVEKLLTAPALTVETTKKALAALAPVRPETNKSAPPQTSVWTVQSETHSLLSRLALARRVPDQRGIFIDELLKHLDIDQLSRGLYQRDITVELRKLTELTSSGQLPLPTAQDPVYAMMQRHLRNNRHARNAMSELTVIASKQQQVRKQHDLTVKKAIEELTEVLGAGHVNFYTPFQEFLRTKFGEPNEQGEQEPVRVIMSFMELVAAFNGVPDAILGTFTILAGEGGQFFVKPEDPTLIPVNRAQQIDRRYGKFYNSLKTLKDNVFTLEQRSAHLEDGKGWECDANDAALDYFTTIFENSSAATALHRNAEDTMLLFVLEPWLKEIEKKQATEEREQDEDLKTFLNAVGFTPPEKKRSIEAEKKQEKVALSEYALLDSLSRYAQGAPLISLNAHQQAQQSPYIGTHSITKVVTAAHLLAKRTIVSLDQFQPSHYGQVVEVLESFERIIDPGIKVTDDNVAVSVLERVKEAIQKVKARQSPEWHRDELSERRLPASPSRYRLDGPPDDRDGRQNRIH